MRGNGEDLAALSTDVLIERLNGLQAKDWTDAHITQTRRLLHELQVHQIELEMQNRELARAQEELEAARDRYADLYDFSPVGYLGLDPRGVIRELNLAGAALLGRERIRLIGLPFATRIERGDQADFFRHLGAVLRSGERASVELALRPVNGRAARVQLELVADRGRDGEPTGARAALLDVTERRVAEERMLGHQAEVAHLHRVGTLSELATVLAHELNNPLFVIAGDLGTCLRRLESADLDPDLKAGLTETLEHALLQARRVGQVIREYRAFARGGAPRPRPLSLAATVEGALALMAAEARVARCTLHAGPMPKGPRVHVDPLQLEQVLVNLIRNGIEACAGRDGDCVTVAASAAAGGMLTVTVTDTGHGIAPDIVGRLFEPFATDKPGGMGMGLSISRTLVEGWGGTIRAESPPVGGTVFRFTLPLASEDDGGG